MTPRFCLLKFVIIAIYLFNVTIAYKALAQPTIVTVSPLANSNTVARNSAIIVGFSQPLTPGSAAGLRVFSNQRGGLRTGNSGSNAVNGNTLSFVPAYDFKPGETVKVSVTPAAQSGSGALAVPKLFQFTAAATGGSGVFTRTNVATGPNPYNVTMADVDNDGDLDMLSPDFGVASVSVRLNNGAGIFGGGSNPAVGSQPRSVTAADIDGDGDLDLLTANYNANSASVRFNNGSGIFSGGTDLPIGSQPQSITTADIDGDGDLDLLATNGASNSVSVLFNNGSGTFGGGSTVAVGGFPFNIATGDIDNDGDLDLLTANWSASNSVSVRLNNGRGSFTNGIDVPVGASPRWIALGDLDNDGDLDLLSANYGSNDVSVRFNNGSGLFGGGTQLPAGTSPSSLVAADIDGDSDLDLLVSNFYSSDIIVRQNNGNGTFGSGTILLPGTNPNGIATADVDGDGDLDLLAANFSSGNVSVFINQPPPLQVRIVGDSVLCNGGQTVLTARGPAPILAYRWSTGATTPSITVTQPGTYSVSVTFTGNSISTDQHIVTAITPTVRVTGDTVLCAGQLVSLLATAPAARSYRWSTGATTAGISVTQPGTYSVVASYGTGCSATAQVVVRAPTLLITGPAVLCAPAGASTTLTAAAPGATAVRWNTGATTAALVVTQPGTYSVVATFPSGCTLTASQVVIRPVAAISGDSVVCAGRPAQLAAALPGVASATYSWSTGATTPTITVTQAGTYTVVVSYGTGCTATARLVVRAPAVAITGISVLCAAAGASTVLTATALGASSIQWNTGATTSALTVTQAGTYSVVATFPNGCTLTASQVVIRPVAAISGDSVVCAGRPTQLAAALPGVAGATYSWSTGATTPTITVTQAGTYFVAVGYGTGCVSTVQQRVRAGVAVPAFSLGADTTLCEGEPLVLRAPASRPGITYRWSDGTAGTTLRVVQPGTYSLVINGECDSRTVSRRVAYQPCLTIPNIVTANNDGQNDHFQIKGLPVGSWSLEIYDRWGRKVYATTAYRNDWGDGAAPGVYYYLLHNNSSAAASYKGWLEVVR